MKNGEVIPVTTSAQTAYNRTMLDASANAQNLAARYDGLAVDIDAIPKVSKAAALGLKALSIAGNMLLSMGISMAISFVIGKVQDLVHAQENAIAKADETISKINEEREALTKTKTTIDSISGDYEKLAKGVDNLGRNVSLSKDEYARYNEIVNQVAEMFPQMVQGYTDEGNAIIATKGNLDELTKAYKEQKKAAQDAIIIGSADVFKGFKAAMGASWSDSSIIEQRNLLNEIVATQGNVDKISKITSRLSGTASQSVLEDLFEELGLKKGFLGLNLVDDEYISENITKFQSLVSKINSQIESEVTKIKPVMQAYLDNSFELNKVDDKTADLARQVVSQFGAEFYNQFENETEMATWIDENIVKKLQNKDVQAKFETALELQTKFNNNEIPVKDYQEKVNALLDAIKALPSETQKAIKLLFGIETDEDGNSTSDVDTMIANVKKKFNGKFEKEIGELTLGELEILSNMDISPNGIESWDEVKKMLAESADAGDKATSSLSELTKSLADLQTKYNELTSAQEEYNSTGAISADTMQKLIDNDLLGYLDFSSGKLKVNTDALLAQGEAAKVAAIQSLQKAMAEDLAAVAAGEDEKESTLAKTAIDKLGDSAATAGQKAQTSAGLLAGFAVAAQAAKEGAEGNLGENVDVETYRAKADAIISAYTNAANRIGGITIKSPKTSKSSGGGSKSSSDKNDALDNYLEEAERRYKIHQDETKYINELDYALSNLVKTEEERRDVLDKIEQARKDYADNQVKDIEHQIEMVQNLKGENADVLDYYRQIQEIAHNEANRLRSIGYDDNSDEVQEWQSKWWDAQDKKLDFYNTQHEVIIRDIEHARDMALAKNPYTDTTSYYKQMQDEYHKMAEIYRSISPEKYKAEIQELQQAWWDAQGSIIDWQKDEFSKATDLISSHYDSQKTLLQSHYDIINSIKEARHDINKELEASKTMYEYLNKDTRKLLFNQEDYNKLSKKLYDIQSKANRLQEQYQYDLENATLDTIEEITSNYEMQYETMMKSYEIAKAELEVAKKRQQLDNVLNERNVRMFINGQWQWVANTQDVINAQGELADAEYARKTAEAGAKQTESINNLTKQTDELGTVIKKFESGIITLDEAIQYVGTELGKLPSMAYTSLDGATKSSKSSSSFSTKSNATAWVPGLGNVGVVIDSNGKTQSDLPKGSVVHTNGGDYKITGGSAGNYTSVKVDKKYANGTPNTLKGSALMGEKGFEAYIDSDGHLLPVVQPTLFENIGAGGKVFNTDQLNNLSALWNMSQLKMPDYSGLVNKVQPSVVNTDNSYHVYLQGVEIGKDVIDIDALKRYVGNH